MIHDCLNLQKQPSASFLMLCVAHTVFEAHPCMHLCTSHSAIMLFLTGLWWCIPNQHSLKFEIIKLSVCTRFLSLFPFLLPNLDLHTPAYKLSRIHTHTHIQHARCVLVHHYPKSHQVLMKQRSSDRFRNSDKTQD